MLRINISRENLDRLEAHAMSGFISTVEKSEPDISDEFDWLIHTIEISDEVADKLAEEYSAATDCSFDEGVWQFNEGLGALLDRLDKMDEKPAELH